MSNLNHLAPALYTETRLHLAQRFAGSTVELTLPTTNPSAFAPPKPPLRAVISDIQVGSDESTFTKNHIASEASIHFRQSGRFPRCFLWRLLDDRRALEIQAVDLTQDDNAKPEPQLSVLLRFPAALRPFGLAFAEPSDKDALSVFALTTSNALYTITLHRECFMSEKATEALLGDWCRIYAPAALKVQAPFRLTACSAQVLFISLVGDSLLKLSRGTGEDGSLWQEAYYTGTSAFQSITRSIRYKLPFVAGDSPAVGFGANSLRGAVIISVALSPDENYIFALCLDEHLRVWHVQNGGMVAEADVSGGSGNALNATSTKRLVPPTQKQVMKVVDSAGENDDVYFLVTFSPETRRFRFWGMMDSEVAQGTFREIHQEVEFLPPIDVLMDTSIWNLEEFHVIAGRRWTETRLWIRVVSGTVSRVFMLTFNLFDNPEDVRDTWRSQWRAVSPGYQSVESLSRDAPLPFQEGDTSAYSTTLTERWLEYLFCPGRFTVPTLETALTVLVRSKKIAPNPKGTLKARLSNAIAAIASCRQDSSSLETFGLDQHEEAVSNSWQELFSLVKDLHRRRCETMALEFDTHEQLPWLVCADAISPIRVCSKLEMCDLNRSRLVAGHGTLSTLAVGGESRLMQSEVLLSVAHAFRKDASTTFRSAFEDAVFTEILKPASESVPDRMQQLNEISNMGEEISDDDFARLKDAMDEFGGYAVLEGPAFQELLTALDEDEQGSQMDAEALTTYGARSLARVAAETVDLNIKVLLDLALLVVFVATEIDQDEVAAEMEEPFDGVRYFPRIMQLLKTNHVLQFMLRRVRREAPPPRTQHSSLSMDNSPTTLIKVSKLAASASPDKSRTSTLLESIFLGGFWSVLKEPDGMQLPHAITYWARRWLATLERSDRIDNLTAHVLADVVKHGEHEYAYEFLPFVTDTAWGTYVKGRLYLATGSYDEAATLFKKCALHLSMTYFDISAVATVEIVSLTDREYFAEGLCRYYCHVVEMFDHQMAHTHVADFARLAIQAFNLQRQSPEAPELSDADAIQSDLLSRYFSASLHTSRFDDAYTALSQMRNEALRRAYLSSFLSTLMQQDHVELILSFPYANFGSTEVDSVLEVLARKALSLSSARCFAVLYSYRMSRGDVRGAAQAAFERLRRLKNSSEAARDPRYPRVGEAYLVLINALACLDENQAWISVEPTMNDAFNQAVVATQLGKGRLAVQRPKCGVLTLAEVRREYQAELDRIADAERGRFPFAVNNEADGDNGGDEMDVL